MYNPIISVNGLSVPCPSSYSFSIEDMSSPDAGRTEDGTMHKMMVGQTIAIELEWSYLSDELGRQVLNAFNQEYSTIVYKDIQFGDPLNGYQKTAVFYTGNRRLTMYNNLLGLWSKIGFKIIGRYLR